MKIPWSSLNFNLLYKWTLPTSQDWVRIKWGDVCAHALVALESLMYFSSYFSLCSLSFKIFLRGLTLMDCLSKTLLIISAISTCFPDFYIQMKFKLAQKQLWPLFILLRNMQSQPWKHIVWNFSPNIWGQIMPLCYLLR